MGYKTFSGPLKILEERRIAGVTGKECQRKLQVEGVSLHRRPQRSPASRVTVTTRRPAAGPVLFWEKPQTTAENLSHKSHQKESRHRRLPRYSYKIRNYDMSAFSSTPFILETTGHNERRVSLHIRIANTSTKSPFLRPAGGLKRLSYRFHGFARATECQLSSWIKAFLV